MDIRVATPDDAEGLLGIYAPYVQSTAITFEYEVPSVTEFRGRIEHTLERYPYLVAVDDSPRAARNTTRHATERLLGYAYAGPLHARRAYDWSVETSIYVDRDERGHGLGRALHDALRRELVRMGITNMCACIALPHRNGDMPPEAPVADPYLTEASVLFHERMGYRMVGRFDRCAYKFDRWYDMVWMELHVAPHPTVPRAVTPFDGRLAASGEDVDPRS